MEIWMVQFSVTFFRRAGRRGYGGREGIYFGVFGTDGLFGWMFVIEATYYFHTTCTLRITDKAVLVLGFNS